MIKSYNDLNVYKQSYELAMEIFHLTRKFPKEERFSLTSQLVRSSRSVSSNICEGWAKKECENYFKQHLIHALGSNAETGHWLSLAFDCKYISEEEYAQFEEKIDVIGKMLTNLHRNWTTFEH